MQLNVTTDYAIRIVLHLAQKDGFATSKEISEEMHIPHTYIPKITRLLKEAKILSEKRGVYGGFMLTRSPDEIKLLDIVGSLEKTVNINRCLEEDQYCSRHAVAYCKVRKLLAEIQLELGHRLDVTISEFI